MCLGVAGTLISGLLGAAGTAITASEQQRNAQRQAEARNQVLQQTLTKNDAIAKDARDVFDKRNDQSDPTAVAADQAKATQARADTVANAVSTPDAGAIPISGSAPEVVKSSLAKALLDTMQQGKARAAALGKLGGYGDTWFNQGIASTDASRNIGVDANYTAGNLGILPYKQDLAEQQAYKPISPIGGILSGLGSALGGGGKSWYG